MLVLNSNLGITLDKSFSHTLLKYNQSLMLKFFKIVRENLNIGTKQLLHMLIITSVKMAISF